MDPQMLADGITQCVEGGTGLLVALGVIPTTIAAPLVIIAAGIGAILGGRKAKKQEQEKETDDV